MKIWISEFFKIFWILFWFFKYFFRFISLLKIAQIGLLFSRDPRSWCGVGRTRGGDTQAHVNAYVGAYVALSQTGSQMMDPRVSTWPIWAVHLLRRFHL